MSYFVETVGVSFVKLTGVVATDESSSFLNLLVTLLKSELGQKFDTIEFCYQRRSLIVNYTTCLNLILTLFVYSFWKSATTDASAAKVRVRLHLM